MLQVAEFYVQNALKFTYEHLQIQKISRGLYPRIPFKQGKGGQREERKEGTRKGQREGGKEGERERRREGEMERISGPHFLNRAAAPDCTAVEVMAVTDVPGCHRCSH